MTKKEIQATVLFIAEVRGAVAALKGYGKDYESPTIKLLGDSLEKSVDNYIKEAKI